MSFRNWIALIGAIDFETNRTEDKDVLKTIKTTVDNRERERKLINRRARDQYKKKGRR